jgi:hypothetical protein
VPIFELALLLAVAGVAAFPCWRHSAEWGYWPSASVGVLLLFVAIAAVTGSSALPDNRAKASAKTAMTTTGAISMPATTVTLDIARQEPDNKSDR